MAHDKQKLGARYEVDMGSLAGFGFSFTNGNDTLIFSGGPFKSSMDSMAAIAAIKTRVKPYRIHRLRSRTGLYFAINGPGPALLATSVSYSTPIAIEAAIESVIDEAGNAPITFIIGAVCDAA